MKKTLITLIVTSMTMIAWSQDHIAIGLKIGTTSTQYTTDNLKTPTDVTFQGIKKDAKTGLLFGAYAKIKLIGNLSLQPEMYYAKKSGNVSYDVEGDEIYKQDVTYHTWDIPILANFTLIDLKVAQIYGITGPVMSFVTKNATSLPELDVKDDAKKATWGYQLGGGVNVWKFGLDARYEWGLSNMSDGLSGVSDVKFNRKSKMLTISLSYKLFGI